MDKTLLDRIAKLLALADEAYNDSEHERELAAKRAADLMIRYGVTRDDLTREQMIVKRCESAFRSTPGWYHQLVVRVAEFCGVAYCFAATPAGRNQIHYFAGYREDIDSAEYLIEVIARQFVEQAKAYRRERSRRGLRTSAAKTNAFKHGLAFGVGKRFAEISERVLAHKSNTRFALVPLEKSKLANERLDQEFGDSIANARHRASDANAFRTGVDAASSINVNPGVNARAQSSRLLA